MDSARFQRLRELFHEAIQLPHAERGDFLQRACGGDIDLQNDVLGMLEKDMREDPLLDGGLANVARGLLEEESKRLDGLQGFGPYRLKKLLGEGGMGVVYLAEREDLGLLVAVKFLRNAWMSPARRQRFADEQRMLAGLNHPSIARLYDADTLADGTPWFVMEYVEGLPITDYCAQNKCSLPERLRLFRKVCEAAQYAHEHAVIHRDLKPSNILVTADGTVKLLDFGIAKQLDSPEQPVNRTQTALRMMTPAYAAPEQIRGEGVGVFTDVYALGVVLYELLAGRMPVDCAEQAPEKPSASTQRAGPPGNRSAWADLDVLCQTAIHKDEQRRYRSMEMLIRDVDHYLHGEPLEARSDALFYRLRKFINRNRKLLIAATLAFTAVAVMAAYFTLRLAAARNTAVAAARRAQQVQLFMLHLFGGADQAAGPAEGLRVTTLVDRGVQEAQTLRDQELQTDLYQTLGAIYQKLGKLDQAERLLQSALDRRRASPAVSRTELAESTVALGLLLVDQAKLDQAEFLVRDALEIANHARPPDGLATAKATAALGKVMEARGAYDKAIPLLERALKLQSEPQTPTRDQAETLKELADTQFYAGHYQECNDLTLRTLAMHRHLYGERHPLVADDLINLGAVQFEWGHYAEAEKFHRQALDMVRTWYGTEHPETASAMSMVGRDLIFEKRFDEAVAMLEEALEIQERVYGASHPKVANILNELANVALQRDRLDEAEARFERVVEIYKAAYGGRHYRVALALSNLASVYRGRKDYPRAEALYRQAIALYGQTLPAGHSFVGIAQVKLGRVLVREKRYQEAEPHSLAGYQIVMKQASPSVVWAQSARQDLVTIYEALGQPAKAAEYREQASTETAAKGGG